MDDINIFCSNAILPGYYFLWSGFSRIPEREWFPIVCCGDSILKSTSIFVKVKVLHIHSFCNSCLASAIMIVPLLQSYLDILPLECFEKLLKESGF